MTGRSSLRTFSFSFFESSRCLNNPRLNVLGRITAAANTGPARQPRPASSHPASINSSWKNFLSAIHAKVRKRKKENRDWFLTKHQRGYKHLRIKDPVRSVNEVPGKCR